MVIEKIDRTIKELWKQDILKDCNSHFAYHEDTLKNAFYYHLRRRLGDGYLIRHRLRIFTEYYLSDNNRADIAIVKLKPKAYMTHTPTSKNILRKYSLLLSLNIKMNTVVLTRFIAMLTRLRNTYGSSSLRIASSI